jgi:3-dehydroquinate synthase
MGSDRLMRNLVITGFSGTGKSVVGRDVARRLGWDFLDTDAEVVRQAGKPIAAIFQEEGEARFRELEREAIRQACCQSQVVIAIGGGAIVDRSNYELLAGSGLIVCLEARAGTIHERLFREAAGGRENEARPLLAAGDPLERIKQLKASRQPYYAEADWTVHTDNLSIEQVAEEVIRAWRLLYLDHPHLNPLPSRERKEGLEQGPTFSRERKEGLEQGPTFSRERKEGWEPSPTFLRERTEGSQPNAVGSRERKEGRQSEGDDHVACRVETATESYAVVVGYGLIDRLGEKMRQTGLSGRAIMISDENVFPLYGGKVEEILREASLTVDYFVVPPGEGAKSMDQVGRLYDFLVQRRVERDDTVVALGGGVVGDLAGFVAATFLRGMPWVQVPTSLVAMVDASIGGKVGVNHPEGKNLIGAFHQPRLVLADPGVLATLPQRELTSGWAEVVKHGLILDESLVEFMEVNAQGLVRLEPGLLTQVIARSAAIKAQVVSQDERERGGKRILLNYGHTIAHGLEAATGYGRFLHGEVVAISMTCAARLSQRVGLLSTAAVQRQEGLLRRFGLPVSLPAPESGRELSWTDITRAMELDKKVRGKAIRWVLLEDIGKAVVRADVPQQDVLAVLEGLGEP